MARLLFALALGALALILIVQPAAARMVYVANDGSSDISALSVGEDGRVAVLEASPYSTGPGTFPRGMTMSPNGRFLFAADSGTNQVSSFSVGSDGGLTQVTGSPVGTARFPAATAITPNGRFLYATHGFFNDGIRSFTVGADGSLTPLAPTAMTGNGEGIAVSPDGLHLYCVSTNGVFVFDINPDGTLTTVTGSPFAGSLAPDGIAIAPSGAFAYVTSITHDDIHALSLAADGKPTVVGGSVHSGSGNTNPHSVVVSPDGTRVYAINSGATVSPGVTSGAGLAAFAVAADGTLSPIGTNVSMGTTDLAGGGAVTPDGRHFFAIRTNGANNFESLAVGADGSLSEVSGSPFADGATISPSVIPYGVVATPPDQGPLAAVAAVAAAPGSATTFDASRSSDPDGSVARYDWDFGDGTSLRGGGSAPQHTYAKAGVYTASVTVADAIGCSDHMVWGSSLAYCNGGPAARATVTVDTPPSISALALTNKRFAVAAARKRRVKHGTTIKYTVSEAAAVSFAIQRKTTGRRVGRSCVKKTRKNAKRRKCTRLVTAGTLSASGKAGANTLKFSGKLRRRKLAPGSYLLTAVATDSARAKSKPVRLAFKIVRG